MNCYLIDKRLFVPSTVNGNIIHIIGISPELPVRPSTHHGQLYITGLYIRIAAYDPGH